MGEPKRQEAEGALRGLRTGGEETRSVQFGSEGGEVGTHPDGWGA